MSILMTKSQQKPLEKSIRKQIINDVGKFSIASIFSGIGNFFNTYFAALILGPTVWGTWQGAKLVLRYGVNLHFGVQNGMHRELPILKGKRESSKQNTIVDVTFSFSFIIAAIVSIGILIFTFIFEVGSELRLCLQFISVMIFLQYIHSFYNLLFKANNEFDIVSKIAFMEGIGHLISIGLIIIFGLIGFLAGQVLRLIIGISYSYSRSSYKINWQWNNKTLKPLILIGFPIMLMVFVNEIFVTIDRLLILTFLEARNLGFYSLGNLIFAPLILICSASNSVMYPRFAEKYGETGDYCSLKKYIIVPTYNLAALISILIGAVYIVIPLLVKLFLPEYIKGVVAARILIFGLLFYAIAGMAGNMLLVINKQVLRLWILLISALLNLGFSYVALKLGYGIVGVATGTSLAYFIFYIFISILAMRYTNATYKEIGKLQIQILGVIVFISTVAVLLSVLLSINVESSNLFMKSIIGVIAIIACSSYFILKIIRKNRLLELLRKYALSLGHRT